MARFIASTGKYKGIIKEDIYIRDFSISQGVYSEILTLDEIEEVAQPSDIVILKSIWGYHLNSGKFLRQLTELKNRNVELVNDYEFIYWNLDKSGYIYELKKQSGLCIIPTSHLEISTCKSVQEIKGKIDSIINHLQENVFVIKPTISASGYLTFKYSKELNNNEHLLQLLENKYLDFIIQPFRSQINEGEISIILTNGNIRYAINRYPGILSEKRDPEFIHSNRIEEVILLQVCTILDFFLKKFNSLPKICRIDFVKNGLSFEIIEVELIDPDLFFKYIPKDILDDCLADLCDT